MELIVQNVSDKNKLLNFKDGQAYDFVVKKLPGAENIWQWSEGLMFTQEAWSLFLTPGVKVNYLAVWNQKDRNLIQVEPGIYKIEAKLTCMPEIIAEPLQIEILEQ